MAGLSIGWMEDGEGGDSEGDFGEVIASAQREVGWTWPSPGEQTSDNGDRKDCKTNRRMPETSVYDFGNGDNGYHR